MPSFDIVSRVDLAEVDNAIAGINREIATRFDFKGSKCTVKRDEAAINLVADDDLKLKQMHELLKVHLTRRKVDPAALEFKPPEKASGNTMRQAVVLRQGVDADLARSLVRGIKDSKLKVQIAVQGAELRVSGKSATICRPRSWCCAGSRSSSRCNTSISATDAFPARHAAPRLIARAPAAIYCGLPGPLRLEA